MPDELLPWLVPGDLDDAQRALYDAIVGGARGSGPRAFPLVDELGRLYGPFNAMLYEPQAGEVMQRFGEVIRFEIGIGARLREIAILEVARIVKSEFEWFAHAAVGRVAGLEEAELDAIRSGGDALSFSAEERLTRELVASLVIDRDVPDALFERANVELGRARVLDLVALAGFYGMIASVLAAYRVGLPPGVDPVF